MMENLPESLKPFYERALQAEERLSRLEEATNATKTDLQVKISQLQSMLEESHKKLEEEQRKVKELTIENEKHRYRTKHLVRALRVADENKSERIQGNMLATTDRITSALKDVKI